jgi:hypothetical protein
MVITTLLFASSPRGRWGLVAEKRCAAHAGFLVVDLAFFAANAVKIVVVGWVPIVLALVSSRDDDVKAGRELLAGDSPPGHAADGAPAR